LVAGFSFAVAVFAAVADPSSAADLVLAALPVAAFAAWALTPRVRLWAVSPAVLVPVVVAQRSGALEPLFFEVSILAFVVARWSRSRVEAVMLGLASLAAPVVVSLIQNPSEIAVGIWILGIAFPWAIGWALARQAQLASELDATRRELAHQTLLSERRRIARDVHDLVGHGLAAVMLQVTSARHVLRRDPGAAEDALRSAEALGRRSMEELRRTVSLLRDDETEGRSPLPSIGEIRALVDDARAGGLSVELRLRGDLAEVPAGVAVALYRIAQEALANAARHAPGARTVLGLELIDGQIGLTAETHGRGLPKPTTDPQRPRYGVLGMRERAAALGGKFHAGPTVDGWRVSCRIPLPIGEESANTDSGSP
jgi:signal transduction histidine kinase